MKEPKDRTWGITFQSLQSGFADMWLAAIWDGEKYIESFRLHRWHKDLSELVVHSHPWDFCAIALWGSGEEELWDQDSEGRWRRHRRGIWWLIPRFYRHDQIHTFVSTNRLLTLVFTSEKRCDHNGKAYEISEDGRSLVLVEES